MKLFVGIMLLTLGLLVQAQTSTTHQPYWQTFLIGEDGSTHQVDLASIVKPEARGVFGFVNRLLLRRPSMMLLPSGEMIGPIIGTMMRAEGNCITRHSVIKHDFMITTTGQHIGENVLSAQDSMSAPAEGSVHAMMISIICGEA